MKKISKLMIIILVIIFTIPVNAAETKVNVMIDGVNLTFTQDMGEPYIDSNGRTQVPLRIVGEAIGAEVKWESDLNVAILQKGNDTVLVPLGKNYIYYEGNKIINDTISTNRNGRLYLPIRVVMESFGYKVSWQQSTFTVVISSSTDETDDTDETDETDETVVVPQKYDSRELNKVTPVKDQGEIGTCWAFAALGALESSLLPTNLYDFSEDHLSLNHGYDLSQDDGGEYKLALAYLASWKGPILEEQDPYGDGKTISGKAAVHLQEARILPNKDLQTIKEAIMEYGAVHTSVYSPILAGVKKSLYYNESTHSLYNFDDITSNHDVVIVGWDDEYDPNNFTVAPPGKGAYIVKNSWGVDFGINGFYYVSYYDKNIGTDNIVYTRVDSNDNYDNIYQYDEFGWTRKLGYSTDTAYFANIYESDQKEMLEAVSFYATGPNTTYEVYYVEDANVNDLTSLTNMTLAASGSFTHAGYYTVDLPIDITIEQGSKFGVVVKIVTPGEKYPVAVEMNDTNSWLSKAEVNTGESFVSYNGKNWEDTAELMNANVCLKAFTNNVE